MDTAQFARPLPVLSGQCIQAVLGLHLVRNTPHFSCDMLMLRRHNEQTWFTHIAEKKSESRLRLQATCMAWHERAVLPVLRLAKRQAQLHWQ